MNDNHIADADTAGATPVVHIASVYENKLGEKYVQFDVEDAEHIPAGTKLYAISELTGEIWEYSYIHSSATGRGNTKVGPCLTYDKKTAFGVGCIEQRLVLAATPASSVADAERITKVALQFIRPQNRRAFESALLAAGASERADAEKDAALTDEQIVSIQYAADWLSRSEEISNRKHAERLRAILAANGEKR